MRSTVQGAVRVGWASVLAAAPALATTWVVDDNGGPGVDFVNIQAAVDAAADGDVIEVRAGVYPGFTIDGKSLVVKGVGALRVNPVVLVTNIDASRRVELDSLGIGPNFVGPNQTSLVLMQNTGSVRLVDCGVRGQSPYQGDCVLLNSLPQEAMTAAHCDEVTLLRCDVRGGSGSDYDYHYFACGFDGRSGLTVSGQSRFNVIDCEIRGGWGGYDPHGPGGDGASAAVFSDGSTLFAHRTDFLGGGGNRGGCDASCGGPACLWYPGNECAEGLTGEGVVLLDSSNMTYRDLGTSTIVGNAEPVVIVPFCIGTYDECPCGNHGAGLAGCEHSFGTGGGLLEGVGNASVAADTVTLQLSGLNPDASPVALLFQGTNVSEGVPFDDGLMCAMATIQRLGARQTASGSVAFGFGEPGAPLSVAGGLTPAGGRLYYQVWYRNQDASFCTAARANLSNGVEITWGP